MFNAAGNDLGAITHAYDLVGNRLSRNVNLSFTPAEPMNSQALAFDRNDWIDGDTNPNNANDYFDPNGNTVKDETGTATGDLYDAENRLIKRVTGADPIEIGYDHEGNRVFKAVGNVTTYYLVDDRNPTGYAQVLAEYLNVAISTAPERTYTYGHDLVAQQLSTGTYYYGYDGHGSVRLLLDSATSATAHNTYDYDVYGKLLASSGSVPNNYLYTGEQWDEHLKMYFLRARYFLPEIGRFHTMDSFEGSNSDPLSLHKYLYCHANPVNGTDPSGHEFNNISMMAVTAIAVGINAWSAYSNIKAKRYAWAAVDILSMGLGIGGIIGPGGLGKMAAVANMGRGMTFAQWVAATQGAQQVSQGVALFDLIVMAMSGATSGSSLGSSGLGESGGDLIENHKPDEYAAEMAVARARGVQSIIVNNIEQLKNLLVNNPVIKFVVTSDGKVRVVPKYAGDGINITQREISHAVAAENQAVRSAGEARLKGGKLEINRWSGHYPSDNWSGKAFEDLGGAPLKLSREKF